jgi:cyclic pyranopterin phosphate synthase
MPEQGITYLPRHALLSYEEMERLIGILHHLGVDKLRITGGEPFVRVGMADFLERLAKAFPTLQLHLTTNGTLTGGLVQQLKDLGIRSVNLSMDSLDPERFRTITRRDAFGAVRRTLDELLDSGIRTRINMVVMAEHNISDILPMVELTRHNDLTVRFIEEMPFNGGGTHAGRLAWDYPAILRHLQASYPTLTKTPDPPHSTAFNYQVGGYRGQVGIIAAYTRLFCGTCNRLRITPQGMLRTCLYDQGIFNLRDILRAGASDKALADTIREALKDRAKDGFEAEQRRSFQLPPTESMATIGG